MASPASPRTVQPQGFTGCGDGVGGRLNFALGTPAGSVLRTNARRVAQPSAIKQDAQISFAGALNHFRCVGGPWAERVLGLLCMLDMHNRPAHAPLLQPV